MIPAEEIARLSPLPDSRLSLIYTVKGAVWRNGAWWEPVFCMSCGKEGGLTTCEGTTFLGWLCDDCGKYGDIDGAFVEPDRIHWARIELEQRERFGRVLTEEELVAIVAADASPLATLIKQGR